MARGQYREHGIPDLKPCITDSTENMGFCTLSPASDVWLTDRTKNIGFRTESPACDVWLTGRTENMGFRNLSPESDVQRKWDSGI